MGPWYSREDFVDEYWICRRALICSTGAAMKETVAPAITPAIPCPTLGSLCGTCSPDCGEGNGVAAMYVGENSVWCRSLR